MIKWLRKRHRITDDTMKRARQEALLRSTIRQTPMIKQLAKVLAVTVSDEEMSVRLRNAMLVAAEDKEDGRFA